MAALYWVLCFCSDARILVDPGATKALPFGTLRHTPPPLPGAKHSTAFLNRVQSFFLPHNFDDSLGQSLGYVFQHIKGDFSFRMLLRIERC